MDHFLPTIIFRHRKENLKKCSLSGLESKMHFVTYPTGTLPDLSGYTILTPDAPPLVGDEKGLFLIDGTWRYADKMKKVLPEGLTYRSIPSGYQTAYPRRQDESAGLASIEALYIAYLLTGRDPTFLLENYHWKENFLKLNAL
ncbi:MAG: hypothetical protein SP1CHLAM54_01890 [Chlamydiia bacterium]|nr:hypothetical protein [Chlamydiia bacterium]MCH9615107.1 hypothetical protein [Chlamydiia bacterium]MCH9628571.1 hypothetical protein [Chlamydiia bacterium]